MKTARRALLLASALALAGCEPFNLVKLYFQEKQYVRDQEVTAKVRSALLADPELAKLPIAVEAYLRDVTLDGTVETAEQARRAARIAENTRGVKKVDNRLKAAR